MAPVLARRAPPPQPGRGRDRLHAQVLGRGRICLTNKATERALGGIALGRKAWLFAGSHRGGERAAFIFTLIGTAKLHNVDPQAGLADVLARFPTRHSTGSTNRCRRTDGRQPLCSGQHGNGPHRRLTNRRRSGMEQAGAALSSVAIFLTGFALDLNAPSSQAVIGPLMRL